MYIDIGCYIDIVMGLVDKGIICKIQYEVQVNVRTKHNRRGYKHMFIYLEYIIIIICVF